MIREIRLYAYFLLGVMLAFAAMAPAHAQSLVHYAASNFMVVSSGFGSLPRTIAFAPSLASAAASGWGPPTIGNVGGGAAALNYSGNVVVGSAAGARVPVTVPVTVASRLGPMAIAKTVVRLTPTGVAVGIFAPLLIEAGVQYANGQWSKPGNGEAQTVPAINGPTWTVTGGNATTYTTALAACNAFCAEYGTVTATQCATNAWKSNASCSNGASSPTAIMESVGLTCPTGQNWTLSGTSCTRPACATGFVRDGSTGICVDPLLNDDQAASAIAAALPSGDPAAIVSAFPPGTQIDPDPATVTGPASVTSPSVTTTNTTNNVTTTVTNSTTVNNTYNNNQITTTVTNNTVTKNAAGEVIATQVEEGTPDPSKDDNATVIDTPLTEMPTLYERKYPDGIKGVWDTRSAEMKATPLFGLTAVFAPSVGGGSCPTWSMSANIGPQMMFGTHSLSPPCWLWTALKAVIIVTALLLARSLIFGG